MSDKTEDAAPKKKGGLVKKLIPIVGVLVLAGGGAAGGYFYGKGHSSADSAHPKKAGPERVKREGHDDAPVHNDPDGDGQYQTTYFEIKKEFTANLLDPNRYIQVGLGVATTYDAKVTEAVDKNEPAVRSAVLGVLGEQSADVVTTIAGKQALQKRLRVAINQVLEQKTGFGGIDDVYFTSFVIQ